MPRLAPRSAACADRQAHGEGRALALAGARRADRAAVQLDEVA